MESSSISWNSASERSTAVWSVLPRDLIGVARFLQGHLLIAVRPLASPPPCTSPASGQPLIPLCTLLLGSLRHLLTSNCGTFSKYQKQVGHDVLFKLVSIREGVTLLGNTTIPRLINHEIKIVAPCTPCLSAIFLTFSFSRKC